MSGPSRVENESSSPLAETTAAPSTTATPRNPSITSVPLVGVTSSSTDALPSAPPLPTSESRPSPLPVTDSRPGLPPAYSGAALTPAPWSASTTFNPQSVDWASLPPPPEYASQRESDDLRIPSYRTLDVGYTRGAPPRYDPVSESNESESAEGPAPSATPGAGQTSGRRRASSATSHTSQRRRSSAASGQRGSVPVDSQPEKLESTKWCMFFLLFVLGVSLRACVIGCMASLLLSWRYPAQWAPCVMSPSVSRDRLAHTHTTSLAHPLLMTIISRTSRLQGSSPLA